MDGLPRFSASMFIVLAGLLASGRAMAEPNVTVTNSPANPVQVRDVDRSSNQPIQISLCKDFGTLGGGCAYPTQVTVPSVASGGSVVQRLVVDYIAGSCTTTGGPVSSILITTVVVENVILGQTQAQQYELRTQVSPGLSLRSVFSEPARLYTDASHPIGLDVALGTATTGYSCNATISGHLATE
jgi:hypothetical protein